MLKEEKNQGIGCSRRANYYGIPRAGSGPSFLSEARSFQRAQERDESQGVSPNFNFRTMRSAAALEARQRSASKPSLSIKHGPTHNNGNKGVNDAKPLRQQ